MKSVRSAWLCDRLYAVAYSACIIHRGKSGALCWVFSHTILFSSKKLALFSLRISFAGQWTL